MRSVSFWVPLLFFIFCSCSSSAPKEETKNSKVQTSQGFGDSLNKITGCSSVNASTSWSVNSSTGTRKVLTLEISQARKINLSNDEELNIRTAQILCFLYPSPFDIDSTLTSVDINFIKGDSSVKVSTASRDIYMRVSEAYFMKGDTANCFNFLNYAIKQFPNRHDLYKGRAEVYISFALFDKALPDFEKSNKLIGGDPDILSGIARCYLNMDSIDKARKIIDKCLYDNNTSAYAHSVSGSVFLRTKDYDRSIREYKMALMLDSVTITSSYLGLAECYLNTKENVLALENANKYVMKRPDFSQGLLIRGKIFNAMKRKREACEDFNRAALLNNEEAISLLKAKC